VCRIGRKEIPRKTQTSGNKEIKLFYMYFKHFLR